MVSLETDRQGGEGEGREVIALYVRASYFLFLFMLGVLSARCCHCW